MSLNLVFAGTPDFAAEILQALLKSPHTILGVLTQPDRPSGRSQTPKKSPVKQLAERDQIPVYQPLSLKKLDEQIRLLLTHADCLIVAAYGLILPASVLSLPKRGCLNVHASLLPRWRGASPIQQAILAGDALSGITIMQMDAGLDTGDMLTLSPCTIELHETAETLQHRLASLGIKALLETLDALELEQVVPQKQNEAQASYAPKISKQDAKIDWLSSALEIDRQIRAFNPWPVAFTTINQQVVRIFSALVIENSIADPTAYPLPPGLILRAGKEGIDVATGSGTLRILEMQLPGGKRLSAANILNAKAALFSVGNQFS